MLRRMVKDCSRSENVNISLNLLLFDSVPETFYFPFLRSLTVMDVVDQAQVMDISCIAFIRQYSHWCYIAFIGQVQSWILLIRHRHNRWCKVILNILDKYSHWCSLSRTSTIMDVNYIAFIWQVQSWMLLIRHRYSHGCGVILHLKDR